MDEVEVDQLERWMIRRTQREKKMQNNMRKTSLSRWKFCVHADKRQMLQQLTNSLQMCPTKAQVLYELSSCILNAVGADGFRLYLVESHDEPDQLSFYIDDTLFDTNGEPKIQKIGEHCAIPNYVARTREPVRASKNFRDPRFPDGIRERGVGHILCQAIAYPDGNLVAVLELIRADCGPPFHEEDEEIAYSYLVWAGIALHYAHLFLNMNKQKKLNDFLLAVVK
jgi:cAMP and cAMP-inhibited cGMP 3',5'-cyclic phosphodiesterase 10